MESRRSLLLRGSLRGGNGGLRGLLRGTGLLVRGDERLLRDGLLAVKRGVPFACAFSAGDMASRSGNATAAPIPRRNVRRGNAVFVINI